MSEENKNKDNEWKDREIGALWKKEGKNQNYFSGRLKLKNMDGQSELNVVGFSNKKKAEYPNSPDVILYQSVPREENKQNDISLSDSTPNKDTIEDETPF